MALSRKAGDLGLKNESVLAVNTIIEKESLKNKVDITTLKEGPVCTPWVCSGRI